MYSPKIELNNNLLNSIISVESARSVIQNSPLLPLYERQFRGDAEVRQIHFSTAIEGNYLNINEIKSIVDSGNKSAQLADLSHIESKNKSIDEVINYRNLVKFIESTDQAHKSGKEIFQLSIPIIRDMHKLLLKNIEDETAGIIRDKKALTVNYSTGEKLYLYEEPENVKDRLNDLLNWYSDDSKTIHPILKAGLLHLEFVRIHPFSEGNGRLARGLTTLSLAVDGYDINHFFCLDEYYSNDSQSYYDHLQKGFKNPIEWLEYFVFGISLEFNRVKDRVVKISRDVTVKNRVGQQFITDRQEKIIEWINTNNYFRNADFADLFPDVSEDTVLRELKGLVDLDIIEKKGKTKLARYEFK